MRQSGRELAISRAPAERRFKCFLQWEKKCDKLICLALQWKCLLVAVNGFLEVRPMRSLTFGRIAVLLPVLLMVCGVFSMRAQSPTAVNLMPTPAKLQAGAGFLKIDETFRLSFAGYQEPRLERAGQRFLEQLHRQTSLVLQSRDTADATKAALQITTDHESKAIEELGEDESYTLEVTASGAKLHAANPL